MITRQVAFMVAIMALVPTFSHAEQHSETTSHQPSDSATDDEKAPTSLVIFFGEGSSRLRRADSTTLDRASRAYNTGKPIVMILTGSADRSGNAALNLKLSQRRADAVLKGLLDRGIPADRFQILAKGETELPVPTPQGVAKRANRRVVISWH